MPMPWMTRGSYHFGIDDGIAVSCIDVDGGLFCRRFCCQYRTGYTFENFQATPRCGKQ